MLLAEVSWLAYAGRASVAFVVYVACLYFYRLYLSPLSRFPGPKLAAVSLFYEGYYDLVKNGRYPWRIQEMHDKYGPVVRINPREIHIRDPDFVDELLQQRLDKDPWFVRCFNSDLAAFGTWEHGLHRQRRGAVNRFFSKASIASRTDVIQDKVLQLCERLKPYHDNKGVVQLDAAFISLTVDVISQFCYGISYNYLDIPGFDTTYKKTIEQMTASGAVCRQVPSILNIITAIPPWLMMRLVPSIGSVLRVQDMVRVQVKRILSLDRKNENTASIESGEHESYHDTETAGISRKATIFDQILDSKLPPEEKSPERLVEEGVVLMTAGSETTARALYLSTVHLLEQPQLLSRLKKELETVMPEPTSLPLLTQLEQLPLLTAIIKESIRVSGSTSTRTSRLSPTSHPIRYKEWVFPPGTPVSMTLFDVLMDERIFPKPDTFDPMRWLVNKKDAEGKDKWMPNTALDRYFVPFSRGSRSCLGIWVAWAELYITMAHVHRKFDLELYQTSVVDVAAAIDRFTCFAKPGSKGVRVRVTGVRTS